MGPKKNQIIRQIARFKTKIQRKYGVKKIILFGSLAKGKFKKDSDIDLIIISNKFKNKKTYQRSPQLYKAWTLDYPVDFLCFTQQEFENKKNKIGIVNEALKNCIEV